MSRKYLKYISAWIFVSKIILFGIKVYFAVKAQNPMYTCKLSEINISFCMDSWLLDLDGKSIEMIMNCLRIMCLTLNVYVNISIYDLQHSVYKW